MGSGPRRTLPAPRRPTAHAGLRRLRPARAGRADPGRAGRLAAPCAARAGVGVSGTEAGGNPGGPARCGADADQPRRLFRALQSATVGADLSAHRRAGPGTRSARAAAPGAVLYLVWLAPDRSHLRSAAEAPAFSTAPPAGRGRCPVELSDPRSTCR